ncbi:hypothetical protein CRUP_036213 [Coryphaenoides rupestris]|nr:hypothetical protein CRUP_036213 [Coryphaenoides rupestris]
METLLFNSTSPPPSPTEPLNASFDALCPGWSRLPQSTLIPALFGVICVLGTVGNALAVYVLAHGGSARRSVANTFMLNLCVSDLLFLLSLPLWAVYYALGFHWPFGRFACKLCGGLLHLNLYASIFFIVCMSMDRYLAIVHPLRSQSARDPKRARLTCVLAWALALACAAPTVVLRDTYPLQQLGVEACAVLYPHHYWYLGLAWMKILLAFLLPLVVISSCYYVIGRHLLAGSGVWLRRRAPAHGERSSCSGTNRSLDSQLSHRAESDRPPTPFAYANGSMSAGGRGCGGGGGTGTGGMSLEGRGLERVLWTVAAVVLAFFFCWFPFHCLTLLDVLSGHGLLGGCWLEWAVANLTSLTLCLGFSNSAVNPVLYCFIGNHFRGRLGGLCKGLCACLRPPGEPGDQKRGSFSTRLSSFSRKLSDLKDLAIVETPGLH